MREASILKRILLACSRGPVRLWRNNCGSLEDRNGRWVKFGVANPGGSDLIGFRSVIITPDMVGTRIAIFSAIEVKQKSGRIRPEQRAFIDNVKLHGGYAGIARSVEEAKKVLTL
jgi:hypothetical protein